jgi:phenol 2-monooxygenase (NADPH)
VVDVEEPYILLVHQGMVEDIFLKDLRLRGVEVIRSSPFSSYSQKKHGNSIVEVDCTDLKTGKTRPFKTQYLVGCDGAHSKVRKVMLGAVEHTQSSKSAWGVLDGKFLCRAEPRTLN